MKKFIRDRYPIIYFCIKKILNYINEIVILVNKDIFYLKPLFKIFDKFNFISKNYVSSYIDIENLNTNFLDDKIEDTILKFYKKNKNKFKQNLNINNKKKIGALFTEIYPNGGHTPLIERFCDSFYKDYRLKLFCTRFNDVKYGDYSKRNTDLLSKIDIDGVSWNFRKCNFLKLIINLHNKIVEFNPDILFCYIHPNDIIIASILALIKNNTNIKIININIQDHSHNLGFKFAHLILDARPSGQEVTKNIKGCNNTLLMPLQQKKAEETIYFTNEEKKILRKELNIKNDEYFTLTGTSCYKIFESNGSRYLEMIRDILILEPKLKHVLMTEFSNENKLTLMQIFNNEDLLNRLIIIDRVPNFDIYMQTCDLFIDSFPQGGALIHLDMMRNKKPTVLKINKTNPIRSFEYYLPKDYEYQYENIEDMKNGILRLLYSKEEQQKASEKLYQYYLDNYEFNIIKKKYKYLMERDKNLDHFFGRNFYENRAS